MSKVFPLHGYAVRRRPSPDEVERLLKSHFVSHHVNAICGFCDLMLEGLDQDRLRNAETAENQFIKRSPNMNMSLSHLRESGCYVETNLIHRPILQNLIKRCSKFDDQSLVHNFGSIVITKFKDIFLKIEEDSTQDILKKIIKAKIPIFAIEDPDFFSVIQKIKSNPEDIDLYEEIIYLSYDYHKKLKIYLQ